MMASQRFVQLAQPMRRLPRLFFLRAIIVVTFLTLTGWPSRAQSTLQVPPEWNKALDTLAEKIAATAKPARTFPSTYGIFPH